MKMIEKQTKEEELLAKFKKAKTRKHIDYFLGKTDRCIHSWMRLQEESVVSYGCFYSAPWLEGNPHWYTNSCTPVDWENCPLNPNQKDQKGQG